MRHDLRRPAARRVPPVRGYRRVRRHAAPAVLAAAVIALAGCATAVPPPAPSGSGAAQETSGALSGVSVPDDYTAVTVRPLSASTYPFLGSDGKYHVVYDLELVNGTGVPATIDRLDVVDARDPSRVVLSLSGTTLVDPDCPYGDCNRLRELPSTPTASATIPGQAARAVLIDFAVDSPDAAPPAVMHRLYAKAAVNPGATEATPVDYLVAPLDISAGTPPVLAPPVKGTNWVAVNGCCLPGLPHRTSLATFNGTLVNGQRFAIDWKRLDDNGRFYDGDKTQNDSYADYGEGVYAVADGTIVSTLDELDPGTPGVLPATDPVLGPQITVETVDGNNIVQDIGGGAYAFYAHLQKGTLLVEKGDRVTKGQMIAKLGNTGNSSVSHMHFHLMNGPSILGSDALPYVIDRFSYAGQVDTQAVLDADDHLTGEFFQAKLPEPQPRTDQLPLSFAIVDFPS